MIRLKPRLAAPALVAVCAIVTGCPGFRATVVVTPAAVSFEASSVQETVTVFNSGSGVLTWTAREVVRVGDPADNVWVPEDVPYLALESDDADLVGGELDGEASVEIDRFNIVADRTGLAPGLYTDVGIEIETSGGTRIVPVSLTVTPSLDVMPTSISIPPNSSSASFTISNQGAQTLNFTIEFLANPQNPNSVTEPPSYVEDIPTAGTVPPGGLQTIVLTINREGLAPGVYETALYIEDTEGSNAIVRVTFGVGGAALFEVTPDAITIPVNVYGVGEETVEEFTISNPGAADFNWTLEFEDPDEPGIPIALPGFISLNAVSGSVVAGREQVVEITVDPAGVDAAGITDVNIIVNATDVGRDVVALRIIAIEGPRLSIQQEPALRTAGLLDFGTLEDLLLLGVGNTGGVGTLLNFSLTTDRPDLIKLPVPALGQSIGLNCPLAAYLTCFDWQQFPIVIDRAAMNPTAEVDGGEIVIEAEGLPSITVAVSVTRAPLRIEGAINRSRPPNVMRFVFLMRDSLLEAIDTTDPDVLANVSFNIDENGLPLELDETNFFVDGPRGLKQNIVLLLDFTGSMFRAREDDGVANGQIIQQMVDGAIEFVDDLPDTYRVAIMEYHDRNQQFREIHPFSTDKDALINALAAFSLPPAQHGASEVYDALADAITALVNQDPTTISFDDADVRSIVFVSDGHDTSSDLSLGEVVNTAKEARVRMYPIVFGDSVNLAPMIELANETGGHMFNVIPPRTLSDFLGRPSQEGQVWRDLQRQVVLTYISLSDRDGTYNITANFLDDFGNTISGSFQREAIFFPGDPRAGQITLLTSGISDMGRAEVLVRTDYVPRNITEFRFRFLIPPDFQNNLSSVDLLSSEEDDGLLAGWRLLPGDDGEYFLVTEPDNPLQYGAFGNLLRLTFDGLQLTDSFELEFRVDNTLYARTSQNSTIDTRFFVYPGGHTNPTERLVVNAASDIAPPAATIPALQDASFNPDAPNAFDRDEDDIPDFDDPFPDDEDLPAAIANPLLVSFAGAVSQAQFTIRNNRLQTFNWELAVPDNLVFGLSFSDTFGTLAPGESVVVTTVVDRLGLGPGTYNGEIGILTDITPDPQQVTFTVQVLP